MASQPLVSVIVPTRNSASTLEACLSSIAQQTYKPIELIVVDRDSTDNTKAIAQRFTEQVFNHGPERSAQVNFGVTKASGEYVYKVDSDFVLDREVIEQCVRKAAEDFEAVVVHNSPDVRVSWIAKIRKFEVDMYKYDLTHSSARFVKKDVYQIIGGFNENITAGEDYDFQNKINRAGYKTGFVDAEALHLGEPTRIWPHLIKYYNYGQDFIHYKAENEAESKEQLGFSRSVYFRHWKKFICHPFYALGFFAYNSAKYFFGGAGYASALIHKNHVQTSVSTEVMESWPRVSFLIPTLNASEYLEKCLQSIDQLEYDKKLIEVVVADGGSTDSTIEIAKAHKATILSNPQRVAEAGKKIAFDNSDGEYVVLLDADNVIASRDWLKKLIGAQKQAEKLSDRPVTTESNYLIAKDFSSINTYVSLLVIADPLARMLASQPDKFERISGIALKHFSKGQIPVAGANGFIWPRKIIKQYNASDSELNEVGLLRAITRKNGITIANVRGIGIYHYYCHSLNDYVKKRKKIASKHLSRASLGNDWVKEVSKIRFIFATLYLFSFIGPLIEGITQTISTRRLAWLWHPIISFLTIDIYAMSYLKGTNRT
jgi:glycosyltransferase involved in cell wall biosynthesis